MSDPIQHGPSGPSPFVKPFLHALNRMQQRETLRPEQLTERARTLLGERFGTSPRLIEAAFAHGSLGLMSTHTHFFDGFALLMPMSHGTAVAVREAEAGPSQVAFEGYSRRLVQGVGPPEGAGEAGPDVPSQILERIVGQYSPPGRAVELSVVSTIGSGDVPAALAALAVAAARALQALFALPEDTGTLLGTLQECIAAVLERPFSIACLAAADSGRPGIFLLIDTATLEQLPLDVPAPDVLGWGLLDVGTGLQHDAAYYRRRMTDTREILNRLQRRSFPGLTSLRELEHRDLERALRAVPRSKQPWLRWLVRENQRVQKLVAALRRQDWQMFGALLLMAHASQHTDGEGTTEAADFVVEQIQAMSIDGMYGCRALYDSRNVLIVGRPFIVPNVLDRVANTFEKRFGRLPQTTLL